MIFLFFLVTADIVLLFYTLDMASAGMAPASGVGKPSGDTMLVDKLPEEINEMKIKDEKIEKVHLYESADNL